MKHAVAAAISVKAFGSLLFFFGSSVGAYLLVRHLVYLILH
jgi:heme oxygenase